MTEADERRWRLAVACLHAKVTKEELAQTLGVTGGALAQWERRGDGKRKRSLTGAKIAAALTDRMGSRECPAEALQAGSPLWPGWVE